jgi:hypothetical protein
MSILVVQIIIKQWDKSQRTPQYIEDRAKVPCQYPLRFPPARYVFDKQCVIDQHGDDLSGNRVQYSQINGNLIQIDRFQINLTDMTLNYLAQADSASHARLIGSLKDSWLQCHYDWRYGVDEGGFYYWLYEDVTLNVMYVDQISEDLFMSSKPTKTVML